MLIIKVKNEEMKREVMRNKGKLKEKEIWIEEDQMLKERKMSNGN